ncbi:pseudouridine synthase [Clostridiaceae bacterium HSG29]|nr:pseudouridine synthase [Clostridiaceae bacterium HSG29]
MRINKYLSKAGYCSRREADKLIGNCSVRVNGKVVSTGYEVDNEDIVMIDGRIIELTENDEYIMLNKPKGITVTTALNDKSNVIDFIKYEKRVFPVGRLDKDSEGLLLLTDDGEIVNKILKSKYDHEKEYVVTVNKKISKSFLKEMEGEVAIDVGTTKKSKIKFVDDHTFHIIITQGLNRQIRKMCEVFGYKVIKLKRIRMINIEIGDLKIGKWRKLDKNELIDLFKIIGYDKDIY